MTQSGSNPGLSGGAPNPAQALAMLDRLLAVMARGAEPHELLGVPPDAGRVDVQAAYLGLARAMHPDQPAFIKSGRTADATQAMAALNGARTALSRGGAASTSGATGHEGEQRSAASERQKTVQALIQKAGIQINANHWEEAEQTLALAKAALGGNYDALGATQLGWAVLNNPKRPEAERDEEGAALLRAVTERSGDAPARALAHYYLALRLRRLKREDRALPHARKAAQLDPRLQPAASLVHLLERRRERGLSGAESAGPVGFWQRLFGRD